MSEREINEGMPPDDVGSESQFVWRVLTGLALTSLFLAGFLWLGFAPSTFFLTFAAIWFGCVLHHAARLLVRWTAMGDRMAMTIVVVLLVGLVVCFFALLGFQIASRINELAGNLADAVEQVLQQLDEQFPQFRTMWDALSSGKAARMVMQGASGSTVASWLASPFGFVVNVLFIFFTGLYLATSPAMYRDGLVVLFPPRHQERLRSVMNEMGEALWGWTLARLASMVLVGVMSWVGLLVLGIPMAATLAIFTAIVVFIPNIGPAISLVPPMLLGVSEGPWVPVYVLVLYTAIQMVESYLITPIIHEHEDNLPAALVITGQLVLGVLFGLLGVAFAMPLILVVKIAVERLYLRRALESGESPSAIVLS